MQILPELDPMIRELLLFGTRRVKDLEFSALGFSFR
jgi:hypothetical protein